MTPPMEELEVGTRRAWRRWLERHHASSLCVWLVFHKDHTGVPSVPYDEAVREALCFGWIDSLIKRLDDDRYARKFTPRKPGSRWSDSNRTRWAELEAEGALAPAGHAASPTGAPSAARPEIPELPDYIARALKGNRPAWRFFQELAPSERWRFVAWIHTAKRPEIRERRVRESIALLAKGKKLGRKQAPRTHADIRSLGFDPADIEVLLASHAHFDHVGGLARMREVTGARVVLSAADGEMIARGGVGPAGAGPAYPAVRADRTIGHLDTVELGPWTLTAQLTPGHTAGCTSWSGRATIGGEPVMFVSVCSLSVLPGFQQVGADQTYPGMGAAYCRIIAILEALQPDLFLAPHGSFIDLDEKSAALARGNARAFVDPDGYREYLERARSAIERTLSSQGHTGGCESLGG